MLQPMQVYNQRTRLLRRRQEEPRCMSRSEYVIITCTGLLTAALGIVVIVSDSSDHVAFSAGIMMIPTGIFVIVLTRVLTLCAVSQSSRRTMRRRPEAGTRGGSTGDSRGSRVTEGLAASTRL